MAMRKSEMEECSTAYADAVAAANRAIAAGSFSEAVENAMAAWPHIDGMMQYGKRYEQREFDRIEAVDIVLRYAPYLLDAESLDKAETLLRNCKRIDRNADADISADLAEARARLWRNHRLWEYVESRPECRQDELASALGPEQEYWRTVAEAWERLGLIVRVSAGRSYTLALRTRLGQVVIGKCAECGELLDAPKEALLEECTCAACGRNSLFVIIDQEKS